MLRLVAWCALAAPLAFLAAVPVLAQSPPAPAAAPTDETLRRAWDLKAEALRDLQEGRYRDGVPKAREAVALRERALGAGHLEVAEALDLLGRLLERSGDYPEAQKVLERSLGIKEAALGAESADVADTIDVLARPSSKEAISGSRVRSTSGRSGSGRMSSVPTRRRSRPLSTGWAGCSSTWATCRRRA